MMRAEQASTQAVGYLLSALVGVVTYAVSGGGFVRFVLAGIAAGVTATVCRRLESTFWEAYLPVTAPLTDVQRFIKGMVLSVVLATVGVLVGWLFSLPLAAIAGGLGFGVGQVVGFVPRPFIRGMRKINEETANQIAEARRPPGDPG